MTTKPNEYGFKADSAVIGEEFKPQIPEEAIEAYLKESTRKNGKRMISRAEALQVLQAAYANNTAPSLDNPGRAAPLNNLSETLAGAHTPFAHVQPETLSSMPKPECLTSKCSRHRALEFFQARRFFQAMAAGLSGFLAGWRK